MSGGHGAGLDPRFAKYDGNIAYSGKRKVYNADNTAWAARDILVITSTKGGYSACKKALAGDAERGVGEFLVAMTACNAGSYAGACNWMVSDFVHSGAAKDPLYLSDGTAGRVTASAGSPAIVVGILGEDDRALYAPTIFAAGSAASGINIDDAGSLITATQVEAALQELKTQFSFKAPTTLTIATGAVAQTQGIHKLDTEGAAGSDDLDSLTGGVSGEFCLVGLANAAHNVVLKHAIGANLISCPGGRDITLDTVTDWALLYNNGTQWIVVAFSTVATGAGGLGSALASTANALGASLVGIEDSGSLITAANVETALAELAGRLPILLADPGTGVAIPVTRSASIAITQNGAETNTLAIPTFVGQTLDLYVDTDTSGARTVTSDQRINQAGNTTILMTEVGDFIRLVGITIGGALRWQVVVNDGCVLGP